MDALLEILSQCPVDVHHVHYTIENNHVILSCEIADIDQGLTVEQTTQVNKMIKELVNIACTTISTEPNIGKISIELSYSSYDDWLDTIGTIVIVEKTQSGIIRIERYDPNIMDTVVTFKNMYEQDLMDDLSSFSLHN